MTAVTQTNVAEVATRLRAIVAAIDAREIDADSTERAYLVGAADALENLPQSDDDYPFTGYDRLA